MVPRSVFAHLGSAFAIGALLAACAVRHASPEGFTIEHDSKQPELAVVEADRHCAKYGKKAELVKLAIQDRQVGPGWMTRAR